MPLKGVHSNPEGLRPTSAQVDKSEEHGGSYSDKRVRAWVSDAGSMEITALLTMHDALDAMADRQEWKIDSA